MSDPFRVGFVDGTTPDKWVRRWRERRPDPVEAVPVPIAAQRRLLDDATLHVCLVRDLLEREGLHLIPLYAEDQVVVLGSEHVLTLLEEVGAADLADEQVNQGPAREAIATAAAGTGVAVVPRSVARMHARRDTEVRRLVDAEQSCVGLAWRQDLDDPRVEVFVGIVRGRTARSSRG